MSNEGGKYWLERSNEAMERNKKESLKLIKELKKVYKIKTKDIQNDIDEFYAKYGKNKVIEYETMTQALDHKEFNQMIQDWNSFVKKYPQFKNFRDVRMGYYQFDKLQGLSNRIALHVAELGVKEDELLANTLKGTLKKAYNKMMSLFSKKKVINKDVVPLKDKRLEALVNKKWLDGNNFSDRLWKNKAKLQSYLDKDLISDIATGLTYDDISHNLSKTMSVAISDARRLVETEMSNIQNIAHLEGIKEAGFNNYKISATLDNKTSKICLRQNDKMYSVDEYRTGITAPPFHPYCRSTIFGVDDKNIDIHFRNNKAIRYGDKQNFMRIVSNHEIGINAIKTKNTFYKNLYVSQKLKNKKQAIRYYDAQIKEVLDDFPFTHDHLTYPKIVIVDSRESSKNVVAGYIMRTNTLYLRGDLYTDDKLVDFQQIYGENHLACSEKAKSTLMHELGHWYQYQLLKSFNTKLELSEFEMNFKRNNKKLVDILINKGYNIEKSISGYAYISMLNDKYEEVYTEALVKAVYSNDEMLLNILKGWETYGK